MTFLELYLYSYLFIIAFMTLLWFVSVLIKNASIVDWFWGFSFIMLGAFYFYNTQGLEMRKLTIMSLVFIWGMRLSIYLAKRHWGKGEDFRYQKFRQDYGPERYWWVSYFQVFLLQGTLAWLISSPLLAAMYYSENVAINIIDIMAVFVWLIGFMFEAIGDYQLSVFKSNPNNKGKLLTSGLWRYTRHPNYFGDAGLWWGFGLFAIASESYLPFMSSILMTLLIIKVSGVSLLEKSLNRNKDGYSEYSEKTNAFFPWFPKN